MKRVNWQIWMDGENSDVHPTDKEVDERECIYATFTEAKNELMRTYRAMIYNYQRGLKRLRSAKKSDYRQ